MKCAVCGKNIIRADLCNEHNAEYGDCSSDRPEWLQDYIRSVKAERENDCDFDLSLDYCEEIMATYPEQRLTGVFHEIYANQERPVEEEAIEEIDRREFLKRLIKYFGGKMEGE